MSIEQAQNDIIEEFAFFDDWMERYQYLIDLGRKLPELPDELKTEEHLLQGCQSNVWVTAKMQDDKLIIEAISDSSIVCGIIALVLRVYSNQTASDILSTEPEFIEKIGLSAHLSPTRSNGLRALLAWIKNTAQSNI